MRLKKNKKMKFPKILKNIAIKLHFTLVKKNAFNKINF